MRTVFEVSPAARHENDDDGGGGGGVGVSGYVRHKVQAGSELPVRPHTLRLLSWRFAD
jgi:hypothetical protein